MTLYRCAACGSPNVVTDTQREGYNYVKGAIGTVVLGVGGAVAGIDGKEKQVFKCPDCGLTLSYSMHIELKTLIDIGVDSLNARENLVMDGMLVPWDALTKNYKNIEKGMADRELQEQQVKEEKKKEESKRNIDNLVETVKTAFQSPVNTSNQEAWEYINKQKAEAREIALKQAEQENEIILLRIAEEINQQNSKEVEEHTKTINELNAKKEELIQKRNGLGFFNFKEKKEIDTQLLSIEQQLQKENELLIKCNNKTAIKAEISEAQEEQMDSFHEIIDDIKAAYYIPESPMVKAERKKQIQNAMINEPQGGPSQKTIENCIAFIFDYAEALSKEELAEVIHRCFDFEISVPRASSYARQFSEKSELIKYEYGDNGVRIVKNN